MNKKINVSYPQAVDRARKAVKRGDLDRAIQWAEFAVEINPEGEQAWLILGGLVESENQVRVFSKALEYLPKSEGIHSQLRKAVKRLRREQSRQSHRLLPEFKTLHPFDQTAHRKVSLKQTILLMLVAGVLGLAAWRGTADLSFSNGASLAFFPTRTLQNNSSVRANPITPTPTPTATPTPTLTPTPTPRPTRTPKPPTATPRPVYGQRPGYIGSQEFWLEVDLGSQQMFVRRGDEILRIFVISGGAWATPTVTGSFQIFSKLLSQNMSGPDYYQPAVPHVMYFFEDYSIHGAYWHNDFGTPRSHGCVNLALGDASWLYQYANIGTWVIIHK